MELEVKIKIEFDQTYPHLNPNCAQLYTDYH